MTVDTLEYFTGQLLTTLDLDLKDRQNLKGGYLVIEELLKKLKQLNFTTPICINEKDYTEDFCLDMETLINSKILLSKLMNTLYIENDE